MLHNFQTPLQEPFPVVVEKIVFGLGCFWGAERRFWQQDGIYTTAVGYAAGYKKNHIPLSQLINAVKERLAREKEIKQNPT